jgi:hypothetical protein
MIASSIIPSLPCHAVDYIGQMAYSPSEPADRRRPLASTDPCPCTRSPAACSGFATRAHAHTGPKQTARPPDAKPGELLALARQLRIGTVMAEMLEPLLA